MEIRPRLKLLGSFGLEVTADYSGTLIKIPLGKRRRVVVQVDDPRGQRQFVLKHNVLPATTNGAVELETGERRARHFTTLSSIKRAKQRATAPSFSLVR